MGLSVSLPTLTLAVVSAFIVLISDVIFLLKDDNGLTKSPWNVSYLITILSLHFIILAFVGMKIELKEDHKISSKLPRKLPRVKLIVKSVKPEFSSAVPISMREEASGKIDASPNHTSKMI